MNIVLLAALIVLIALDVKRVLIESRIVSIQEDLRAMVGARHKIEDEYRELLHSYRTLQARYDTLKARYDKTRNHPVDEAMP